MNKLISTILCLTVIQSAFPAVRGDNAMYMGGTVTAIKEGSQGEMDLSSKFQMEFVGKHGRFAIAYSDITALETGMKSGYRVGLTVALAATTMGIAALPILLAKKKKHYLTISYLEDGKDTGVMMLELSKGIERSTTAVIVARSGKKLTVEGFGPVHEPLMAKVDHTPISTPTTVALAPAPVPEPVIVAVAPAPKPEHRVMSGGVKIYGLD